MTRWVDLAFGWKHSVEMNAGAVIYNNSIDIACLTSLSPPTREVVTSDRTP